MSRLPYDSNALYPSPKYQNANPMANFQQMTYNQNPMQHTNFNQAYIPHKPMIETQNFTNGNNVYHNNLNPNLLAEGVTEYTVDIDSFDRDITTFPNPFKYNVTFAPVSKSGVVRQDEYIDPSNPSLGKHSVDQVYNGPPQPYIRRQFKNIKYIRLESVSLPKYGAIKDNGSGTWIMDTTVNLCEYRHIVVKFKNIESNYNLSTSTVTDSNGVKVIPNTIGNGNTYYAVCNNTSNIVKTFHDSQLGNLDRLYIEFYDDYGTQLSYSSLDSTKVISDVRNPLNRSLQNNITLVFGVVENELSTKVKYDN